MSISIRKALFSRRSLSQQSHLERKCAHVSSDAVKNCVQSDGNANGDKTLHFSKVIPPSRVVPALEETLDLSSSSSVKEPHELIGKRIIGGRFKIVSYLESGGIADIYVVSDASGNKYAAKVLQSRDSNNGIDRILREIEVMVLLSDAPNILSFTALGHIGTRPIIVSEFAESGSLDSIARSGELTFKQAVKYFAEAANGLSAMHNISLVHRDIKPKNIVIANGTAKLCDFDLSGSTNGTLATTLGFDTENTAGGTAYYMPPEQIQDGLGKTTFKSDIYSLGVSAYHIFTGRLPFTGRMREVFDGHIKDKPAKPSSINKRIPKMLEELILRAMSKDPVERPEAVEFKNQLEELDKLIATDKNFDFMLCVY